MIQYKSPLPEIEIKYRSGSIKKVKIKTSKDAFDVLLYMYNSDTLEYIESSIAIFLNKANNTIGWFRVSQGGISGTVVDIKVILGTALKSGASGIILSHNHPSGNLQPSAADINLTKKLNEACNLLDIDLLDHIIVAPEEKLVKYYSFKDDGII